MLRGAISFTPLRRVYVFAAGEPAPGDFPFEVDEAEWEADCEIVRAYEALQRKLDACVNAHVAMLTRR